MDEERTNKLGKDSIGRLLFSLAAPAIIAQLVNMLYSIVDRIYIGHIPNIGANALTGVGVTFPIIMVVSAFSSLIGMGSAPFAQRYQLPSTFQESAKAPRGVNLYSL